jgi:hypothetical protein
MFFDEIFKKFMAGRESKLVDWLVEQMGRSKRTEALRARTEAAGKI